MIAAAVVLILLDASISTIGLLFGWMLFMVKR